MGSLLPFHFISFLFITLVSPCIHLSILQDATLWHGSDVVPELIWVLCQSKLVWHAIASCKLAHVLF